MHATWPAISTPCDELKPCLFKCSRAAQIHWPEPWRLVLCPLLPPLCGYLTRSCARRLPQELVWLARSRCPSVMRVMSDRTRSIAVTVIRLSRRPPLLACPQRKPACTAILRLAHRRRCLPRCATVFGPADHWCGSMSITCRRMCTSISWVRFLEACFGFCSGGIVAGMSDYRHKRHAQCIVVCRSVTGCEFCRWPSRLER